MGHSYIFYNVPREDILSTLMSYISLDPFKRKYMSVIGTNTMVTSSRLRVRPSTIQLFSLDFVPDFPDARKQWNIRDFSDNPPNPSETRNKYFIVLDIGVYM